MFNFVKVIFSGYLTYKYPDQPEFSDFFNKNVREMIINSEYEWSIRDKRDIRETETNYLDESKDEKCGVEDSDELICIICAENKRKIIILPCRHSHTCIKCSKKLDKCPVCRSSIQNKIQYIN